jgi:periplasmic divalent cation tolerance protein
MDINWVYITAANKAEARSIGKILIEERLAACVNIFDGVNSLYMWEGKLQDDKEVVMVAKTTAARMPALIDRVKTVHSYDCPCIVSLPLTDGNPDFLNWIKEYCSEG